MIDIHNYKRRLEHNLENIKKSSISDNNKETIFEFHRSCLSDGLGYAKLERYVYDLKKIAEWLEKDFQKCDKVDMHKLVLKIETSDYSEHTKQGLKIIIKKFFKFLRGIDERAVYPEEVRWIRTNLKNNLKKLPEDLLTEEEIRKMLNITTSSRGKALIAMLYESGCRIGELLNLKIKNSSFDEYGAKINVSGKTGSRTIRIIFSVPYLQEWINKHPNNSNRESYVFSKDNGEIIGYKRVCTIIREIAEKAGIKKRVNPHSFRHSRATYLANHLTEAQMKEFFGWTQSSKMAAIYVHLSGRDVDNAVLKSYGIKVKDEEGQKSNLQPIKCSRCNYINEATNQFCKHCGLVLDEEKRNDILKKEMEINQYNDLLGKIVENKEMLTALVAKIAELQDPLNQKIKEIKK